jgi:hypothetical protein
MPPSPNGAQSRPPESPPIAIRKTPAAGIVIGWVGIYHAVELLAGRGRSSIGEIRICRCDRAPRRLDEVAFAVVPSVKSKYEFIKSDAGLAISS